MGVIGVTWPIFILPQSNLLIGEAIHFKFGVLFDTEEY